MDGVVDGVVLGVVAAVVVLTRVVVIGQVGVTVLVPVTVGPGTNVVTYSLDQSHVFSLFF